MVSPLTLTPYDSEGHWQNLDVVWYRSEPGYEIYTRANGDENAREIASIKVNTSTNVWSDNGSDHPFNVQEVTSGGVVYIELYSSSGLAPPLLKRVLKPTVASWINPPSTNSVSDVFVSYVVEDNELRVYIPLDKPSTVHPNPDPAGRDLYYQLRKVSGTSFFQRIVHTQGTATNETIVPTTAGIYQLEKVQTNPTSYTTYDTAEVTQAQLDFYATNNPPDDDPPEDDPPNTPVFIRGSARRGNLNFW
jgi:1,2-phenylacetyl-CoA epoxidase PaaB subunit